MQCLKDGDILYDNSMFAVVVCMFVSQIVPQHLLYCFWFRKRLNFRSVSQKIFGFFLQILEGNGHKRTQREGLCTATTKSEQRYDIYLEQTAVYRYIVAALLGNTIFPLKTYQRLLSPDPLSSLPLSQHPPQPLPPYQPYIVGNPHFILSQNGKKCPFRHCRPALSTP